MQLLTVFLQHSCKQSVFTRNTQVWFKLSQTNLYRFGFICFLQFSFSWNGQTATESPVFSGPVRSQFDFFPHNLLPRIEAEDEHSDSTVKVPKISYTISTFSLEKLKKLATCRKSKSHLIDLSSDLEWVNVKAHMKIVNCNLLFPQLAVIEDAVKTMGCLELWVT